MTARTRVVILGAGFAGLELATRLSDEVADLVDVTLIDQSDAFTPPTIEGVERKQDFAATRRQRWFGLPR